MSDQFNTEDDRYKQHSLDWLKKPSFLISLLGIVLYWAGYSYYRAKFNQLNIPPQEIHLAFDQYVIQGIGPAIIMFLPLGLILSISLFRRKPGRALVAFLVIYPILIIAFSHIVDRFFTEAILWFLLAAIIGPLWWKRGERLTTLVKSDWFLRLTYAFLILIAAGHIGSALGYTDGLHRDGNPILLEMADPNHPLHNETLQLVIHHMGNYYVREIGSNPEDQTHIISENMVLRATLLSPNRAIE